MSLACDIARPAPHVLWGEQEPYNAICPECEARYMRRGRADGFIDVAVCHECEAKRAIRKQVRKLQEELRHLPTCRRTDARRRHLEEGLLAMGGRLPGRRAPKLR